MQGLSPVVATGGHSSSRCAGLSPSQPLLLQSTGSRRADPVIVAHGPSCSAACGIFPDQGSNPCPLHWQADSQPLCHQGSPKWSISDGYTTFYLCQASSVDYFCIKGIQRPFPAASTHLIPQTKLLKHTARRGCLQTFRQWDTWFLQVYKNSPL